MKKYEENPVAKRLRSFSDGILLTSIIGLVLAVIGYLPFGFVVIYWLVVLVLEIIASTFSTKRKFTREFINHIETKLEAAVDVYDYQDIRNEFEYTAIKDGQYCLSWPRTLKKLHTQINASTHALEKLQKHLRR